MLRSVAAPLVLLLGLVFEGGGCTVPIPWAVNPDSSPRPVPTIPGEWLSDAALVEDALLTRDDIPAYMDLIYEPTAEAHFVEFTGGPPHVYVAATWTGGLANVYRLSDNRSAFESVEVAEQSGADRDAGFAAQYDEIVDFDPLARAYEDPPDLAAKVEQRSRSVIATRVVDRVQVELVIAFDDDDPNWLEQSRTLFALAVQRTQEALDTAGD
jgi:hypothetical protein